MRLKIQKSYAEIVKEREEEVAKTGVEHSVPLKNKFNTEILVKSSDEEDYEQIDDDD